MSNCEKCGNNTMQKYATCVLFNAQSVTDQGIRSKILACPDFAQSQRIDYAPRDQSGAAL